MLRISQIVVLFLVIPELEPSVASASTAATSSNRNTMEVVVKPGVPGAGC
jgi:hypothetical protein